MSEIVEEDRASVPQRTAAGNSVPGRRGSTKRAPRRLAFDGRWNVVRPLPIWLGAWETRRNDRLTSKPVKLD